MKNIQIREIIKAKAEINETEKRKMIKSVKQKSGYSKKIDKIDK